MVKTERRASDAGRASDSISIVDVLMWEALGRYCGDALWELGAHCWCLRDGSASRVDSGSPTQKWCLRVPSKYPFVKDMRDTSPVVGAHVFGLRISSSGGS